MLDNSLRMILLENQKQGMLGEKIARDDYMENGFKIRSTTIGSDFIAYKVVDGKKYEEYVEVKTGKARQSFTQKRKMKELKRLGINYTIYRVTEKFLSYYLSTNEDYRKKGDKVDRLQKDKFQFDASTRNPSKAATMRQNITEKKMYMQENRFSTAMIPNGSLRRSESISETASETCDTAPKTIETTTTTLQALGDLNV